MMSGNAHSVGALLCGLEGPVKCGTVRMEAVRFTLGVRRLNTPTWSSVKAKSTTSNWPKLLRISEEMRQWSAMLEQDLRMAARHVPAHVRVNRLLSRWGDLRGPATHTGTRHSQLFYR